MHRSLFTPDEAASLRRLGLCVANWRPCFGGGDNTPAPTPIINAAPAAPTRADEENKAAVDNQVNDIRRRQGLATTQLTGGLGDSSYGQNVRNQTLLGGR